MDIDSPRPANQQIDWASKYFGRDSGALAMPDEDLRDTLSFGEGKQCFHQILPLQNLDTSAGGAGDASRSSSADWPAAEIWG